jgi:hypothetical protein
MPKKTKICKKCLIPRKGNSYYYTKHDLCQGCYLEQRAWPEEDIQFLKNNFFNIGCNKCAEYLSRSAHAVAKQARKFGLKVGPKRRREIAREVNENNISNMLGKKYGCLTVLSSIRGSGNFLCLCDCGKQPIVCQRAIKHPRKKCSCYKDAKFQGCGDLGKKFFHRIKRGAEQRKMEFNVSIEYLWDLYIKQERKCALTGWEILFSTNVRDSNGTASLDRIDSSQGYTIGNCQWVNKHTNKMKWDYSQDFFIETCRAIANYYNEN